MAYTKLLAKKYASNRACYKSSDHLLEPFLKKFGIKDRVILDFGCGDGSETGRFIELGAELVVGTDPSSEMIRLAKQRKLPNSKFVKTVTADLPLKSNYVDLVYSRFVLHYINNLTPAFKEIYRVLKKDGVFLAIFQCLTIDRKYLNYLVPINLGTGADVTKIKLLAKSVFEVKVALKKSGLRLVNLDKVKNTDSQIDPKFKHKSKFINLTYILFAKKM